jgi:hypothetical protein
MEKLGDILLQQMNDLADRAPCYFCERTGEFKRKQFKLAGRPIPEVACPKCTSLIKEEKLFAQGQKEKVKMDRKRRPRRTYIR